MQKCLRFFFAAVAVCALAADPSFAALKYTAIGASDAIGTGSSDAPATPNGGYVFLISDWLDARYSAWTLDNLGMSGYTASNIRDNSLSQAVAHAPNIVTLWVGGNDIKDSVLAKEPTADLVARFEPAYTTIVERLRNETDAYIVTANLPDFSRIPVAIFFPADQKALAKAASEALNEIITRVAAANNVPVVDLASNPASYARANFSNDGFHPNDAGYAVMAAQFEDVLRANAWRLVSGLGDVNGDGVVDAGDTVATLQIVGGLIAADDRQSVAADTAPAGGDSSTDIADALQTLRRVYNLAPDAEWR
jgi:lysophospholipase L1-like esterase